MSDRRDLAPKQAPVRICSLGPDQKPLPILCIKNPTVLCGIAMENAQERIIEIERVVELQEISQYQLLIMNNLNMDSNELSGEERETNVTKRNRCSAIGGLCTWKHEFCGALTPSTHSSYQPMTQISQQTIQIIAMFWFYQWLEQRNIHKLEAASFSQVALARRETRR